MASRIMDVLDDRRLELGPTGGSIQFEQQNQVDAARIVGLIQRQAQEYRLEGPLKLRITRADALGPFLVRSLRYV